MHTQEYSEYEGGGRGRDIQQFFDFQGVFFFLLGILGGVLVVVLALVLVQQGKVIQQCYKENRIILNIQLCTAGAAGLATEDQAGLESAALLQHGNSPALQSLLQFSELRRAGEQASPVLRLRGGRSHQDHLPD